MEAPYELAEGEIWRTARKEHTCRECGKPISKGQRYIEYLGESPAYEAGHRNHVECARAANSRADEWSRRALNWNNT